MQRLRRDRYWIEKRPLRAGVFVFDLCSLSRKERELLGNDPEESGPDSARRSEGGGDIVHGMKDELRPLCLQRLWQGIPPRHGAESDARGAGGVDVADFVAHRECLCG